VTDPRSVRVPNDTVEARRTLWSELRDAIRGTGADYTKIPLPRAVFLLSVPMVLELVLESTFAVVDIYFVGKLGSSAVATVGLTETMLFLLYAIGMGLAMAVTAVVARRIGEGKRDEAGLTAVQAIWIALLVSVPFAIAGIVFAQDLLRLMGADAWTLEHGYPYTQWALGGNAVVLLLFTINAVFRGAGDAAAAMRVLWLANGLNIVLDPILIFGFGPIPAHGIAGAAIATVTGRGVGVLLQLWILFRGGQHLRVLRSQILWHGAILWNIVRTSFGGIGQMIVAMTSWIFLMRILAGLGSDAVAGATIALRIMMFTMMPAWGMSNAAATLVGQNLGAQPRALMGIFTTDPAVIAIGAEWLRILSYSLFVYGWWMVSVQAFNGAGDTATPTWINAVFFWLVQIPLSWLLAVRLDGGHTGVFWGVFVSETSVGLFTLWLFTRGKWKTAQV
jgi:putative MATE family efflux protein